MKTILLLLLFTPFLLSAEVFTLWTQVLSSDPKGSAQSPSYEIEAGEVLEVLAADLPGGSAPAFRSTFQIGIRDGISTFYFVWNQDELNENGLPVMAGPAQIFVVARNTDLDGRLVTRAFVTFRVSRPGEELPLPSNSVVIPTEPQGNVRIVLESSIDQVTWTEALPGEYGTGNDRRFFRVRAERIE